MPNPVPSLSWLDALQTSGSQESIQVTDTVIDNSGDIIVVGAWAPKLKVNIGSSPPTFTTVRNSYLFLDAFVLKVSGDGNTIRWFKQYGSSNAWDGSVNNSTNVATSVTIDQSNNVVVAISMLGPINFGGGVGTLTPTSARFSCVASLSPVDGSCNWASSCNGCTFGLAGNLNVHPSGNIIACFAVSAGANFAGKPLTTNSFFDFGIGSVSSINGTASWAVNYGSNSTTGYVDSTHGVVVDKDGNVCACCLITGSGNTNLGGGDVPIPTNFTIGIGKYSGADGSYLWSHLFGTTGSNTAGGVSTDPISGIVYLVGTYTYPIDFGKGNFGNSSVTQGGFLTAFDSSGVNLWTKNTGLQSTHVNAVHCDSSGNIFIGGVSGDAMLWGIYPDPYVGGGRPLFYTVYFTSNGTSIPKWNWTDVDTSSNGATSINNSVCIKNGNVAVAGRFVGEVILDGLTVEAGGAGTYSGLFGSYSLVPPTLSPPITTAATITPFYAPSSSPTFQAKFAFKPTQPFPSGVNNILVKYLFPNGTISPTPGTETTPFLLYNFPDTSGFPTFVGTFGFVYKVSGGGQFPAPDGNGSSETFIDQWKFALAWANSSGSQIGPWSAWQLVTRSHAVILNADGTIAHSGFANLKVTTIQTSKGPMQVVQS